MQPAPAALDGLAAKPRRWRALRRLHRWIRRRVFREEQWTVHGAADADMAARMLRRISDHGRPFLFSLPRLSVNRLFVGRITAGDISLKRRTHPAIWLVSPGTYYFSGRMAPNGDGGLTINGEYRLRPALAVLYYIYFTIGAGFLIVSALAMLLGLGLWAGVEGMDSWVALTGLGMLARSGFICAIGGLHIVVEKWLDRGNRRAVRALLGRAAGAT